MVIRVTTRREFPNDWSKINPILGDGELGIEREDADTIKFKIGNGIDKWSDLPYCEVPSSTIDNSALNQHIQNLDAHGLDLIRAQLDNMDGNVDLSGIQSDIQIIKDELSSLKSDMEIIVDTINQLDTINGGNAN